MMELNEKQFIIGFNAGYLLAEYEPKIITVLLEQIRPVNSYISGMCLGQKEFELEQTKSHLNKLRKLRQNNREEKDVENKYKGRD